MRNLFFGALFAAVLSANASAVSFGTTAVIDGITYTINASGSRVQQVGNTLSFSLPQAFALSGIKNVKLSYSVFSDPSTVLDRARQSANIATEALSTVKIGTTYNEDTYLETAGPQTFSGTSIPSFTHTFINKLPQWTSVDTIITLTSNGGYAKASIYNIEYVPVPEPVTFVGMAAGLFGLMTRKRKEK